MSRTLVATPANWSDMSKVPIKFKCNLDGVCSDADKGFKHFLARFPKDASYQVSGRVSEQMTEHYGLWTAQVKMFADLGLNLTSKLSVAERDLVKTPWYYAYRSCVKGCGPEYGFLGSVKVTLQGVRRVRLARFDKLVDYVVTTRPEHVSLSLNDINNAFASVRSLDLSRAFS